MSKALRVGKLMLRDRIMCATPGAAPSVKYYLVRPGGTRCVVTVFCETESQRESWECSASVVDTLFGHVSIMYKIILTFPYIQSAHAHHKDQCYMQSEGW